MVRTTTPSEPPDDGGRLMTAAQVAETLFSGTVSAAWVRRQVPFKVVLGHSTVRWFERDVLSWLVSQRRTRGWSAVDST